MSGNARTDVHTYAPLSPAKLRAKLDSLTPGCPDDRYRFEDMCCHTDGARVWCSSLETRH